MVNILDTADLELIATRMPNLRVREPAARIFLCNTGLLLEASPAPAACIATAASRALTHSPSRTAKPCQTHPCTLTHLKPQSLVLDPTVEASAGEACEFAFRRVTHLDCGRFEAYEETLGSLVSRRARAPWQQLRGGPHEAGCMPGGGLGWIVGVNERLGVRAAPNWGLVLAAPLLTHNRNATRAPPALSTPPSAAPRPCSSRGCST